MKRSLGKKVRALGIIQVVSIAAIMALLGVLFFNKMLSDSRSFESGTTRVKTAEAEGLAKLLALELGRLDALRYALTNQHKEKKDNVRAVLWEKVTFIGVLEELDLIAKGPDGRLMCIRPMGWDKPCEGLDALTPLYDGIDRMRQLEMGVYVVPLYVAGSFWGLIRMRVSDSQVEDVLRTLAEKNERDLVTAVGLFIACFVAVAALLFYLLSSFFGRIHRPLLALTQRAVAFGEDPEAQRGSPQLAVDADPEDEIGVLAEKFGEMQGRLVKTLALKDQAMAEMREKDEQLRRSERMASVGVLAATVAHEIGNKLNPMGFAVHNIKRRLEKGKPLDGRQIDLLAKGIESATAILDKLRSTARPSDDEELQLNDVLDDSEMFLGNQVRSRGYVFEVVRGSDVPLIMGHRAELVQVVLNLVKNAREAIDPKQADKRIDVETRRGEKGGALLTVKDNGAGMTAEVLARIYEPGFTTKGLATGDGTGGSGLGLHVSYGILKRHGVTVVVNSEPGQGTEFVMEFPPVGTKQESSDDT